MITFNVNAEKGKRSPTTSSGTLCYRYMYTQLSFVLLNLFKTRNPLYSVFLMFFFFFSGNQADPYRHQAAGGGKSASV